MANATGNITDVERANALEDRFIALAVRIIKLSASLPKSNEGRHIAGQILRSGTSPAPNYGEARAAESRADFQHKLKIVLKELRETSIWVRIIMASDMLPKHRLAELLDELDQLCRIVNASLTTSRGRARLSLANSK